SQQLLTARISLPPSKYSDIPSTMAFFTRLDEGIERLPGVQSAGLTTLLPMTGRNSSGSTYVEQTTTRGLTTSPPFPQPYLEADLRTITPAYFGAMQVPLLRGRFFTADDLAGRAPVIIVDETFAKRIWPERDPLGQRLAIDTIP